MTRPKAIPLFLLGAAAFLYFVLFIPPFTPTYVAGDSSVYLLNAKRMLEGQWIYKDFFQFTLPGTEIFYFVVFKIFGLRIWVPNATLVILGVGLAAAILHVSRKVIAGITAFLPSALFLTFVYWQWLDPSHHWFSTLLAMAALALVIKQRSPARLVEAGAVCGLATVFTQSTGVTALLGLAIFLLWEHRRKKQPRRVLVRQGVCLFAPFVSVVGSVVAYFAWKAGLKTFLFCTVEFGVKYFPSDWSNNFRVYLSALSFVHGPWHIAAPRMALLLFVYALLPAVYVLFYVYYHRRARFRPTQPWNSLFLVNTFGLVLFLGVAPAPADTRLFAVSPPALIILAWFLATESQSLSVVLRLFWICAVALAIVEPSLRQAHWRAYLSLPTGSAAFAPQNTVYDKFMWVRDHTHPGDVIFEAAWPDLYFPLDLRDAAAIPFLTTSDYTRPRQVQELVEALERNKVRLVLWDPEPEPIPSPPGSNHLAPFLQYLKHRYRVVKTFANGEEVWERH